MRQRDMDLKAPAISSLYSHFQRWFDRLLGPVLLVIAGIVLGQQYVTPNRRVIPVLLGLFITGLAWRVGIGTGLGVLVIALPFPRSAVFGNTNLALILLMTVIWLLRVTQRISPPPRRSPVDLAIVGLIVMYVLSFYNVHDHLALVGGVSNFEVFLGAVLTFYLVINNLRTGRDLERLHNFMLISAFSVFALAVLELNNPGRVFIPGWIKFSGTSDSGFDLHDARVGSVFNDFELLSEYCALTLLLGVFMLVRARALGKRLVYGAFVVLNTFVLFTTVTRGAIISIAIGLVYLLWMVRRRLRFVPLTIALASSSIAIASMNFAVANFTRSGDMFARLQGTKVVGGWMPEDRAGAWTNAWDRAMVHPVLGIGPAYVPLAGFEPTWPHNLYLYYANTIGFTGLFFFIWLLVRCFMITRPQVDDLAHPDYAKAFLLLCRVQIVTFAVDEFKIEYLRNPTYTALVWLMIAVWVATARIARTSAAATVARVGTPIPVPTPSRLRAVGQ